MNNAICTFFGHRDCTQEIKPELYKIVETLITEKGCHLFYIRNHGAFDSIASAVLSELKVKYNIKAYTVLAYMPAKASTWQEHETILPEEIEKIPKRFAIIYRNKWMVDKADFVITYVEHNFGGAAKFKEYAVKKEKIVINICDNESHRLV